MIVPSNKLLLWVAVVVLPFALLGAVEPAATALSVAAVGGLFLAVLIDALRGGALLRGLSVQAPKVARMSRDREASLEIRIHNPRQKSYPLRIAIGFPKTIETPQEEITAVLPAGSENSSFPWKCIPRRRGVHHLRTVALETPSPWGFWAARRQAPVESELRVYPNLAGERKDLAALFLRRGMLGLHAQRQIGKGREFEKLREYVPGDSYEDMHWKATARRAHPITKVFQIERTQEVYVVIDASRLSARPAPGSAAGSSLAETNTALERFLTAALTLGLAAEHQGDFFGVVTFTDSVGKFVRARNGKAHYNACRDALYTLESKTVTPDFDELCTFLRLRLRRRALLVFLTALDDPALAESFVRNLDLIRRQHLVLVNMLQPAGVAPLFSDPGVSTVDDLYGALGGHLQWHNLRELQKVLQRRGVNFSLLKNERLSAELVSQYLNVKQRQLI
jgi:uncharacterized protein (DUF58 family)